ncbi:MAG TPA: phosphopantetheine-binding protein [Bryobacteraceae bacterium]|jgi:acyl carrier protein|nr:phosphopantetheine-binding protein [Bryobacteraceae bacterium]
MSDDLIQRVISVIAATQHIDAAGITPDSTFEELKIDSLDGINIVFALENEFNISIPDDAAKNLRSVRDAAEGIRKLLESGDAPAPAAV